MAVRTVRSRASAAIGLAGAAMLCLCAGANVFASPPPPAPDQLLVTSANSDGSAVLDLNVSPSSPNPPFTPKISNTTTQLNSVADAKNHSRFDALVWVSNPYCKTLDLIVADAAKGQIVRYPGPTTQTLSSCYTTTGAPTVNPTAQSIFTWVKPKPGQPSPGPAQPNALSVDTYGNLFVVSSSGAFDSKPSVWVLPFNAANGTYGSPVLIDNRFGGVLTLALAETLIAPTKTPLWNAGDLLVLVGDSFAARLIVYSQGAIYANAATGVINPANRLNLAGPSSTAIPFAKFLGVLADPFGMDIWPANTTLGTNTGVLFTTIDGRILRFDTAQNKFIANFASGLGLGLQKIKVGTYDNVPYAFVAQVQARNTGQILAFAAPPASGANKPLAAVTMGFMNPLGLAVANSGSTPVNSTCTGSYCSVSPLGPVATTYFSPPNPNFTGTVTEQLCTVDPDPRTSVLAGNLATWSCPNAQGYQTAPALQIGAGTPYCPSFPTAIIPGSVCGHSGPDGRGLAVIEGTALGVDPVDNNTFFATPLNIDAVLPGPGNLECSQFSSTGRIPLTAWGTRSDLTTVEGTIPEDSLAGFPFLGGAPGYLAESTTACDTSTSGGHGISIFAFGLGLSNTSTVYVYALQNEKSASLLQTVESGNISGVDSNNVPVQTQLENDINTINRYVSAGQTASLGRTTGPPTATETADINCALNEINATDQEVHGNLGAFSANTPAGTGDTDPAGAIDSGLANWYATLNTEILLNAPVTITSPPFSFFPVPAVPLCQGQTQLYTITATVTGLTGTGLQLQDSFNNSALGISGTDVLPSPPSGAPIGNGTFTFETALAGGDGEVYPGTQYTVTANAPAGQTCTVTNGTGTVANANITSVVVTCGPVVAGPPAISNVSYLYQYQNVSFISTNLYSCNVGDLLYAYEYNQQYNLSDVAGSGTWQSAFYVALPAVNSALNGTDTITLTCYDQTGTIPVFGGPLLIINPAAPVPSPSSQLTIATFTADTLNNALIWATSNSTSSTNCALLDEFGNQPETSPPYPPQALAPMLSLPASSSGYVNGEYLYPNNAAPSCPENALPDTVTLSCSDPANGAAVQAITVTWSPCGG
jgi:hypothetical protein